MKIKEFLPKSAVIFDLKSRRKEDVITELITPLAKLGYVKNIEKISNSILEREKLGSTGIGQGIAVPHAKSDETKELVASFGLSIRGVKFDALDEGDVFIFFLILAPLESTGLHLKALARIARLLKDKIFRNTLRKCKSAEELYDVICEEDERTP